MLADADYRRESEAAIPERYRVPNEAPVPLFVQADFGLDTKLQPQLVEIQGFPSLYAYQPVMANAIATLTASTPRCTRSPAV